MVTVNNEKLVKLQCTFPKLTESNQQYMLGIAEGLKHVQNNGGKKQVKRMKTGAGKTVHNS